MAEFLFAVCHTICAHVVRCKNLGCWNTHLDWHTRSCTIFTPWVRF